jgi:hypothetical protein
MNFGSRSPTNLFAPSDDPFFTVVGDQIEGSYLPVNTGSGGTAAGSGPGSVVAVTTGGIIINLLFDAAAMAAPASFRAGIQQAATILSSTIFDRITVNLKIDYSGTGGGAAAGPDSGFFETYTSIRADLVNNATPGDTIFNTLPSGSSIQGQSSVAVWNAQLKLLGFMAANDTTTDDGSATFATDINSSLLVGVALHELTHALGRVPYGSQPDVFDLFRFTSAGVRLFSGGATAPAAYFSVDGGTTKLADYGKTSDASDFLNSGVQGPNDPFNEFYTGSTIQNLSAMDLKQLDALGFHITPPVNHAPVITVPSANVAATAGQVIAASSLFTATDADGNTLSYYIYDDNTAANSGHFVVNGTVVPAQDAYLITAAQLAQTSFVAGAAGTSDQLRVIAYDGQTYSNNSIFNYLNVNVAGNHAPVITVPSANVAANAGQVIAASNLFSASDADGDTLSYYLYDANSASNSGHFVVNGTVVPSELVYAVSAAQLAQTSFVAGAAGTSDELRVIAFDGQTYSNNSVFNYLHVNVAGVNTNHAPVITVPSANVSATAGQVIAASSLFSASDADGDTLSYYVYDDNVAANSGHFVVNGTVVPSQFVCAVSAAQLAQTTFVAGAAGTSDELRVIAYDGQTYSNNSVFTYLHVNVALPTGPAPQNTPAASGDQFVFAANLGQRNAVGFSQGSAANPDPGAGPSADHFNQIFGASGAAPTDGNGAFGAHIDATVDPLALFGLHAAPHAADHFGV